MSDWRKLAAEALGEEEKSAKPSAAPEPAKPNPRQLPAKLARNLEILRHLPAPERLLNKDNWRLVVADAMRLADEGWAAQALQFEWPVRDLFGCGSRDSGEFEGLAIWLRGRRISILDDKGVIAIDELQVRHCFRRPSTRPDLEGVVPVALWEFGRR